MQKKIHINIHGTRNVFFLNIQQMGSLPKCFNNRKTRRTQFAQELPWLNLWRYINKMGWFLLAKEFPGQILLIAKDYIWRITFLAFQRTLSWCRFLTSSYFKIFLQVTQPSIATVDFPQIKPTSGIRIKQYCHVVNLAITATRWVNVKLISLRVPYDLTWPRWA